jgi:hypothetical protein
LEGVTGCRAADGAAGVAVVVCGTATLKGRWHRRYRCVVFWCGGVGGGCRAADGAGGVAVAACGTATLKGRWRRRCRCVVRVVCGVGWRVEVFVVCR